jgi:hypothetical protein
MAVTNTIPPQAYTRDVLVKAIEWMQQQPQSVREKATSADLMVSFYMQACRRAAATHEAPVSQENFKQDLKHLAEGLKQFEDIAPPPHHPGRFPSYGHAVVEPIFTPQPVEQMHVEMGAQRNQYLHQQHMHQQQTHVHVHQPAPPPHPQPAPPSAPKPNGMQWTVDAKSLAIARDVQQRLNLSSESEAIRMLITFGAQKARDLFGP